MNLYVWPPLGALESIDPESLAVITYVKIAQAPVNIFTNIRPWSCPSYSLPFLQHSLNSSVGLKHIIPYFRKENYGVEYNLTDEDLAKLHVLSSNIHQDLIPAVDYLMWYHSSNYNSVTRSLFAEAVGFPMSLFWSNLMKSKATSKILSSRLNFQTVNKAKLTEEFVKDALYNTAKRCLTSLEYILNEKEFFISNKPTYVDAVLYGYLWPILHLDYELDGLIVHVKQCNKIMELLVSIHQSYYHHRALTNPNRAPNEIVSANENTLRGKVRVFLTENWIQIRNSSIFVLFVSTMMICYAKSTKVVK